MSDSRSKNVIRNVFWGCFGKIVTTIIPFGVRTVMIYYLGMEYAGLSGLFTSVLMMLSLAELGIGNAIVYSMYRPMAGNDVKKVCALLNFYRRCYRRIGILILTLGLILMPFIRYLIHGDIPPEMNIYYLYGIYLLNNVLGYFLFSYRQSLVIASQRVDCISKINTVVKCISGILQIMVIIQTGDYYLTVLVLPLLTVSENIIVAVTSKRLYPQYRCEGEMEPDELFQLKKRVSGLIMQKIGGIVNGAVDTIVISMVMGLSVLAKYQNYYMIVSFLMGLIDTVNRSFVPSVGDSMATDSVGKNYRLFKKINFVFVWISSWFSICLICMYQPFISLWLGKAYLFESDMVILFGIYLFIYKWCDVYAIFQDGGGLWWNIRYIPLIAAVVNLTSNLILIRAIGLPGILLSTILAIFFVYNLGSSKILFQTYFREIRSGFSDYWKRQFGYLLETAVMMGITFWLCNTVTVKSDLLQLVINAAICVIIPAILYLLIWRKKEEMSDVRDFLKTKLRNLGQ